MYQNCLAYRVTGYSANNCSLGGGGASNGPVFPYFVHCSHPINICTMPILEWFCSRHHVRVTVEYVCSSDRTAGNGSRGRIQKSTEGSKYYLFLVKSLLGNP